MIPGSAPGARAELGVYVHVPFCEVKCAYCHFAIDPRGSDHDRHERYVRALEREVADVAAAESRWRGARPGVDSVYLGGGTPSLLSAERLGRVLRGIGAGFRVDPAAEVTLEANPADLDTDGYRALVRLGVNRVSLGVQRMDDAPLEAMGRRHRAADAPRAVRAAREAGVADVSIDLILGWPGETRSGWLDELDQALALSPDHVSLYLLERESRTLLDHRLTQGTWRLPDDDLVADLHAESARRLSAAGLCRYEISSFARPGHESRHNLRYWADADFLGFGMSAHGYRRGRRYWNHASFAGYCSAIEAATGSAAVAGERTLSPRERRQEALFTGLRRADGVDLAGFEARYAVNPLDEFGDGLEECLAAGLLERDGPRLRLAEHAVLVSNEVFRRLV